MPFVQMRADVYDDAVERCTEKARGIAMDDPFDSAMVMDVVDMDIPVPREQGANRSSSISRPCIPSATSCTGEKLPLSRYGAGNLPMHHYDPEDSGNKQ